MSAQICLEDFEKEAETKLDRNAWCYFYPGAVLQTTLHDNIQAYNRYCIRPRVLCDVSHVDISTSILGNKISIPVGVSPTALQCMAHHDGEKATARACKNIGTCMITSTFTTTALEEIEEANGSGLRWCNLYIFKDKQLTKGLVKRAEAAGYKAIVVTLDGKVIGLRYADIRNGFVLPKHLTLANFTKSKKIQDAIQNEEKGGEYVQTLFDLETSWQSIDWLRSITSLPIVLKGILRADDAREATKHNIQGILVSNHGGRQLDSVPATIDALPSIVDAVEGSGIEVYVDGGIRHGTDVLKALALGARAVFIGRPVIYGLACDGEDGVYRVLDILREEVRQAFTLSGCKNIKDVQSTKDLVIRRSHL